MHQEPAPGRSAGPAFSSGPTRRAPAGPHTDLHRGLRSLQGPCAEAGRPARATSERSPQCAPRPPGDTPSPGKPRPVEAAGSPGRPRRAPGRGEGIVRAPPRVAALFVLQERSQGFRSLLPATAPVAGVGMQRSLGRSPKGLPFQHHFKVDMYHQPEDLLR